ncbi:hypothetical protein MRX96_008549 [Rhipicephalus microplus]
MLFWTLVVCLAVAASAESTEADGLACNETIVQQLKEIGQRIGSFLPDPWLLSSQSSGSRKGQGFSARLGPGVWTFVLTFPGPRVTGLSVEEVKLTDLALKKGVKEGDRVGDFLLQVTSRVVEPKHS